MPQTKARAPRKFKNRKPFAETRFGKLPAEIRNSIYRLALKVPVSPEADNYPYFSPRHKYPGGARKDGLIWYTPGCGTVTTRPSKWLGLLRVCSQMYQDAVHVWYDVNYIEFKSTTTFVNMSNRLPNRFQFLRKVRIGGLTDDPILLMHALTKCTDLKELTVMVMNGWRKISAHTHWVSSCARPRILDVVEQVRGLESVEFLSYDCYVEEGTNQLIGPLTRPLQAPIWKPWQVDLTEKMAEMMMRPKLIATDGQGKRKRESGVDGEEEGGVPVSKRLCA
ncbi:MAG: hypothetical protein Q9202_001459 [Teloschistes flavicans]